MCQNLLFGGNAHVGGVTYQFITQIGRIIGEYLTISLDIGTHTRISIHCLANILHSEPGRMAVLLSKETLAQSREHVPILTERIDILLGNATKHGGIHVPTFGAFRGIHISGNIEVVIVLPNLINAHQTAELIDITILRHHIHDAFDIARTQLVVLTVLSEILGGIHNKHMVIVAVLAQHHHDSGNARAKEDVRWQSDDGLNMVVLH